MEDFTDERNSDLPQIEDYGTTDTDTDDQDSQDYSGTTTDQGALDDDSSTSDDGGLDDDDLEGGTAFDQQSGGYTGGTLGTSQSGSSDSGQFGEYGDSGIGTDLTDEMNAAEGDVDSGLVKGGDTGDDAVSGPGQYGGAAGGISGETY